MTDDDEMYEADPQARELAGMLLLDDLCEWLTGYVRFPSDHAAVAITLWIVHTWLVHCFDSTPRLALVSPEKRCAKSRTLELLELTCAGAETLSDASPAYLYRRIGADDAGPVTILLDEADAIWQRRRSADETAQALRSIVDQGYRKAGTIGRVDMSGKSAKLTRFCVYAPAAIAGIGDLPGTIMDRSVVVRMRRRAPGETVRRYRERVTRPEGEDLRTRLAAWCETVAAGIGDKWPDMPDGISDRAEEIWEPLIVIAEIAGGAWPELARAACTALVNGARDSTVTVSVQLLADIRSVWEPARTARPASGLARGLADLADLADEMPTSKLLDRLCSLEESPWSDWHGHMLTARGLSKLLKDFEIEPDQIWLDGKNVRGYKLASFADAWKRYLT